MAKPEKVPDGQSPPRKSSGKTKTGKARQAVVLPEPPIVGEVPGMAEEWKKLYRVFIAGWDE